MQTKPAIGRRSPHAQTRQRHREHPRRPPTRRTTLAKRSTAGRNFPYWTTEAGRKPSVAGPPNEKARLHRQLRAQKRDEVSNRGNLSQKRPSGRIFACPRRAAMPQACVAGRMRTAVLITRLAHNACRGSVPDGRPRASSCRRNGEKSPDSGVSTPPQPRRDASGEIGCDATRRYAAKGFPAHLRPSRKRPNPGVRAHRAHRALSRNREPGQVFQARHTHTDGERPLPPLREFRCVGVTRP